MPPISTKGLESRLIGLYVHRLECESIAALDSVNNVPPHYRAKADIAYLHEHGGTGGKVTLFGMMLSDQTNKLLRDLMASIEQDAVRALFKSDGKQMPQEGESPKSELEEGQRFLNSVINSYPPEKVFSYPPTDEE